MLSTLRKIVRSIADLVSVGLKNQLIHISLLEGKKVLIPTIGIVS